MTHDCAVLCDWSNERIKDADGRRDVMLGWALGLAGAATLTPGTFGILDVATRGFTVDRAKTVHTLHCRPASRDTAD